MNTEDFPALYRSSDGLSVQAQNNYLRLMRFSLAFLILGSLTSLFSGSSEVFAIVSACILSLVVFISLILARKRYDITWYLTRAIAESVKTITWRYVMKAKPFNQSDPIARTNFLKDLNKILSQNRSGCCTVDDNEQITQKMIEIRNGTYQERLSIYLEKRVKDQSSWYIKKARYNATKTDQWFYAIIGMQFLAVLSALVRISEPQWNSIPTSVLTTMAASSLSWMQTKRYQELSSSYGLTANEIGIIKSDVPSVVNEVTLCKFVGDAENAFSREHTQWQARRDYN
ncbi:MAG: DUF4231 domain-containing protein [Dehalococcoides mccartyi]|uniref:DUF4231 domain-containing protein n=1 Tax=Dehalococcoides mccartyi TaxID=61435 RepID=UPI00059D27CB